MPENNLTLRSSSNNDDNVKKLIKSDSPIMRVIAGPGSGKTTCLKSRVKRLVEDRIDPKKIFVGTFTRAITKDLKDKLDEQINVSTIHSLAYKMLREHPVACQGMRLRFLLQYEEDTLLYDIANDVPNIGNIYDYRNALKDLQASRSRREEIPNARFGGAVRRWLQKNQAMLIGETVYLCVVGLESRDIPPGLFDHVVIDEYQDLTAVEQELVRFTWSGDGTLAVMGDNDQSIYGFRFNHPRGIEDFHTNWHKCEDLKLVNNYRCGKRILHVANLMMAEAGSNKQPMIWKNERAGDLKVVQWETLDDEIKGLARYVNIHAKESFLILVPRRFIGYRLAEEIGDDAKTAFSEQILEHPIAQESFTTASLLSDPDDFVAVRTYLGYHGTRLGYAQKRNADAYHNLPTDSGGRELISDIANGRIPVTGTGKNHIKNRAKKATELLKRSLSANEIIDISFNQKLAEGESNYEKRRWLIKDLQGLHDTAYNLLTQQNRPNLSKIIATMRYKIASRSPLYDSDVQKPRVNIMTLHSAKGLEADNIIISGIADQFMPGKVKDQQSYEEKRRLLYVAVTRARDRLIISWPRQIRMSDMTANNGRLEKIRTHNGIRWAIASRSSLLPQGLAGVIPSKQLFERV